MRRCIIYVLFLIAVAGGGLLGGRSAYAASDDLWLDGPINKTYEGMDDRFIGQTKACGGEDGAILLRGEATPKNACVFGTSAAVRMARYTDEANKFAYAVAFPDEPYFTHVEGLCEGLAQCVYGQAGDTLLLQVGAAYPGQTFAVIKEFSQYLSRGFGSREYQFNQPSNLQYLKMGNNPLSTGVAAVSADGRWILIELVEYGLMRMDTTTGALRRVVAGASAMGGAPMSLDISDDGHWAVKVGHYNGVYIYKVDDSCGDTLTGTSQTVFSNGTTECRATFLRAMTWFAVSGEALFAPRFSANGEHLTLYRRTGVPVKTILTPKSVDDKKPFYIAFGDSFSSGEGESKDSFYFPETNTSNNHCHVSTRSYPYLLQIPWAISAKNLACSGSRMEGVFKASSTYSTSEAKRPTLVSLSIGGNDADFMGKLKTCIGLGTCEWAQEKYRASVAQELRNLFPRLVDLITELKQEYAPANLFVVGYPDIVNAQSRASCPALIETLLNVEERKFMRESIRYLNKILKAAAYNAKVKFADIETAYGNERLCDSKGTAMNGLRYGDDIAPIPFLGKWKFIGAESFHPTPRGHQLAALAIVNGLGSTLDPWECDECTFSESDLDASSYWQEGVNTNELPTRLLAKKFLDKEIYTDIPGALFHFIKDTFMPNTVVTFELHSEETKLAETTTDDDGSLDGTLELPLDSEGYHTVHAIGTDHSGETVDMYQTVYIGEVPEEGVYFQTSVTAAPIPSAAPINSSDVKKEIALEDSQQRNSNERSEDGDVRGIYEAKPSSAKRDSSVKSQDWWVVATVIAGCVAFVIWIIFIRRRKPPQQTKR